MSYSRFIFILISILFVACQKDDGTNIPTTPTTFSQTIKIVQDDFEGVPLVLIGSAGQNFIVAYERQLQDGTKLEFEPLPLDFPVVMKDQEGNEWDINGLAVEGPRTGERLNTTQSYIGFWFAWGTMYPGIEIFNGPVYEGNFEQGPPENEWTIPITTVVNAVGLDGIPSVDNPKFEVYKEHEHFEDGYFVADDELVTGITINGETHLYPHKILNWHEIVNDQIDDVYFSLSFCPLTGSSIAWNRNLENGVTTFGVSGFLYNGNLVSYDRNTSSFWSQMLEECINGDLIDQKKETFPVIETTWQSWKKIIQEPFVLTTDTGVPKDYEENPYEHYITNHDLLAFPVEYDDTRLPRKERVLGVVISGKAKAYRFQDF